MTDADPIAPPDDDPVPPDQGRSWWLREALAQPTFAGDPAPRLEADTTADVVIVGGGYTGLWTAWFLKQIDPGVDIVVLEQDICGGGPSGRNGGFVNSFWNELPELCDRFGDREAVLLCERGETSVRAIGEFCAAHGIDAWFRPDGLLDAATSQAQVGRWADLVITMDRLGISDRIEVLGRDEMRSRIDGPTFHGAVATADGATVHPARLVRGLRRVVMERGVRIFEDTHVVRFGAGSPVVAETERGTVRAGAAVLALNAWAKHWRRFRRILTVRGSYMVMTAPAPERLEELGWTDGVGLSDLRSAIHYVRRTPDGRIAFGIGGMQPNMARHIDARYAYDRDALKVAIGDLHRMFPSFTDVQVEAGWGGPIDVSGLHVPFFGSFETGNVHYGLGYTGNGVGPSHLGGRILANRALGRHDEVLELPIVDVEPRRFPPEPIRSPGVLIANHAIVKRDRAQDAGEEPNPFTDFVAKLPRRLGYNLGP